MQIVGVIPARYRSTRLDGKPLAMIGDKPMIQHVYERASESKLLSELIVATDDERIRAAVAGFGGRVAMTSPDCPSGTDRVAEVAARLDARVVVNIQGDEPFLSAAEIDLLVEPFRADPDLDMSTLAREIVDPAAAADPNVVKVVLDRQGFALYFSRSSIPYRRRADGPAALEHIGLYAFRKEFLARYAALEPTPLERTEALEQLRAIENGHRIRVLLTSAGDRLSVDTPEDLAKAVELWSRSAAAVRDH